MIHKINVDHHKISHKSLSSKAICFTPTENKKNALAIFTHGYTAEKTPLIPWITALSESGIPSALFDLPGHKLADLSEVDSFEEFIYESHNLFLKVMEKFNHVDSSTKLILGGHSLGGYFSMKALMEDKLSALDKIAILVGVGLNPDDRPHLFSTKLFEKMIDLRSQFVSEKIPPKRIFSWLHEAKKTEKIFHQKIILLAGEDDVVVGKHGIPILKSLLEEKSNIVTAETVSSLPHNNPELATKLVQKHTLLFLNS